MSTKKIATSTLWQLSSQIVMAALSIIAVKFVAIGLSKELAGNYNSAYGFLQLFGILADFGLYAVAVREVSKAQDKSAVLGAVIVLRCLILALSLGAALLFAWLIPAWRGTPLPLGITIAALVPFFTLLAGTMRTVFQVEYRMHYVFIAEVVQRIITTSLIGTFIYFGVRGSTDLQIYHMFLFFGGAGAFVLFAISLFYADRFIKIKIKVDREVMKRLMRAAAPFGIAFLCTALYRNIDITLIALLRDDFELQNAYYGFVLRMAEMGYLLPTFLLNSTLPILSEREAKGEDTKQILGKTLFSVLLLGSVSLLFAWLWARPLIALMTTESYLSTITRAGSDTALRLIAVPMFLNGLITYAFYVLLTKHVWRQLVWTLLFGVLIAIGCNLWLIPQSGFVGAAQTAIVVNVVLAALLLPQALRLMPVAFPWSYAQRWLAFTVILGAALWLWLPLLTGELLTVIGLAAMGAGLVVIGLMCGVGRVYRS